MTQTKPDYIPAEDDPEFRNGRKATLTPQIVDGICELVRLGAKPKRAALSIGVAERTWNRWKQQHAAGVAPYADRMQDIFVAEAVYLSKVELCLGEAAVKDWKASLEVLTRRAREDYGAKLDVAVTDKRDVREITTEELERIAFGGGTSDPT